MASSSKPNFEMTLILSKGANDSHYKMVKVLNPALEMWVVEGCEVCKTVEEFFTEQGVKPKLLKVSARSLEPEDKPTKSKAKSTKYPLVQYTYERQLYPVPLPKLHDGAPKEKLLKRLRDAFRVTPTKLHEHQNDLLNAFEDKDFNERHTPAFLVYWEMGSGKTLGATSLLMYKRSMKNLIACTIITLGSWVNHIMKTPFNVGHRPSEKNHRKKSRMAMKRRHEFYSSSESEDDSSSSGSGSSESSSSSSSSSNESEDEDVEEVFTKKGAAGKKATVDEKEERVENLAIYFEVIGYTAFRSTFDGPSALRSFNCVILDEAHYFRNETVNMRPAMAAIHGAKNVIQLTGTWLVNDVEDVAGMVELTDLGGVFKRKSTTLTPEELTKFMQGNVSWFDPRFHRPNMYAKFYPKVEEMIVKVPMTFPQTLEYLMALRSVFTLGPFTVQQGKTNRYNCQTRAVCNAPGSDALSSPKLRAVLQNIKERLGNGPQVVHSSLVETGVSALVEIFKAENVKLKYDMITGSTANEEREKIRQAYNKGKLDVLLITDACQMGMDLLGTFAMHAMEQAKNRSTENQTKARVIRMGSHKNAPFNTVQYIKYISTFPTRKPTDKDLRECEEYLIKVNALGKNTAENLKDVDIAHEIAKMIKEEKGVTINERQEKENETKQAQIDPYLDALRAATIYMSTQKETQMFEEDKTLSSTAALDGVECNVDDATAAMDTSADAAGGATKAGKAKKTVAAASRKTKKVDTEEEEEEKQKAPAKKPRKQSVSKRGVKGLESMKPGKKNGGEASCACGGESDEGEMSDADAFQSLMKEVASFESLFPPSGKKPRKSVGGGGGRKKSVGGAEKPKRRASGKKL